MEVALCEMSLFSFAKSMENKEVVTKICDGCQKVFKVYKPTRPGKYPVKCPFCSHENFLEVKPVAINLRLAKAEKKEEKEPMPTVAGVMTAEPSIGMLVWRKFLFKKRVVLVDGVNTIGRKYEDESPQIAINDKYISRNSAVIIVENSLERGTTYQFVLKKTRNPVLVNGRQMKVGESIYLQFDDVIQMGHTTLTFKKKEIK